MAGASVPQEHRPATAGETATGRARLQALMARGCTFLGTRYAIMGGAMTWVSDHALVAAISEAGGFGVLAGGALSPEELRAEIRATRARTGHPFGVNIITLHPAFDELIEMVVAEGVSHVVLGGGLPKATAIRRLKDAGTRILCFAPSLAVARKLLRAGADALIIEGSEAGGHVGPVSTQVLAQEILPELADAAPIFVAGGIGHGALIAAYLEMGAAGVQLGTRFVCARESRAHPRFKQAFIRAHARDAVTSIQLDPRLPVIPVRALRNTASEAFLRLQREMIEKLERGEIAVDEARLAVEHFWAGALRRAVIEGDVENGSLMAGQSVGMVRREQTAAEIIAELAGQAADQLARKGAEAV
ncbi:MAG: 2-nitropropane dioxygenase [Alphaproteobacteria bacterium]|nr:MAG: 2-nitropropane dioxygenase [Alphaproteobacteria bacterium]